MNRYVRHGRWAALLLVPVAVVSMAHVTGLDGQQNRQSAQREVQERLGTVPTVVDTTTASQLSGAFRAAANRALPAVVFIGVEGRRTLAQNGRSMPVPPGFPDFFPFPNAPNGAPPSQGTGSGFIIDGTGHIITNAHVVSGAERLTVRLVDGREYNATVVGADRSSDVAVIKIEPGAGEPLPVSSIGDSDQTRVGDWVLALGNPLGLDFTVTAGIVSARGRPAPGDQLQLASFIQTDAAINPGNSGGPLIDLLGRVVGINSAIQGGDRFVGYGFAVPINLARRIADDLLEYGYLRRPKVGVVVGQVNAVDAEIYGLSEVSGALISAVEEGSPAQQAGVRLGDVVTELNDRRIDNHIQLIERLARMRPGETASLGIIRDGRPSTVRVRLGEFPHEDVAERQPAQPREEVEQVLGFTVRPIPPQLVARLEFEGRGVAVADVVSNSAALAAGVVPNTIVTSINGTPVRSVDDVRRVSRDIRPGSPVSLRIYDPAYGERVVNYRTRQ